MKKLKNLLIITFMSMIIIANAQEDTQESDFFDMSLEEMMNMQITVASQNAMSIRETPGIVTVLTEEEIINSGAADLMEVLRLVPGFENSVDVTGLTGMTFRGNMGYIGRVLLMIDGQEVNELFYSCSLSDNHYPVDNIKKIEIIRGPGSAIYGGFAELGVINVITKNGKDLNGVNVSTNYGLMTNTFSHRNIGVSAGKEINDDLSFALHGFLSEANRSNRQNPDLYGDSYDMTDKSKISTLILNANVNFKGLESRFILDDYLTSRRDNYDANLLNNYDTRYKLLLGELKYDIKISDKFTLTPKYNLLSSIPWQSIEDTKTGDADVFLPYHRNGLRNKINLAANINPSDKLNLIAGGEFIHDNAETRLAGETFWDGKTEISYTNISGFAQGILQTNLANVTVGARFDKHSQFGVGFAPRIGLTKAFDKLHLKVLASQAFRSPSFDEIDFAAKDINNKPVINPEITKVAEAEIGYQLSPIMSINANAFYAKIDNTILFTVTNGIEGYNNSETSGSKGFEIEYLLRMDKGFARLNYSFYSAKGINEVDYYKIINETVSTDIKTLAENELVGTSPHKISLNSSFNVFNDLYISPSFTYMGKKHAYTEAVAQVDGSGAIVMDAGEEVWVTVPEEQEAVFLLNLFINYNNVIDNLNISAGVHNILDSKYNFSQPYNGWHGPLPGEGRRISFKLSYDLNFD